MFRKLTGILCKFFSANLYVIYIVAVCLSCMGVDGCACALLSSLIFEPVPLQEYIYKFGRLEMEGKFLLNIYLVNIAAHA